MKLALLILPSVLGDVLPMCLPMNVPATAESIDVSATSLEADTLLYDPAAFTFSDPAMVVSYDCMCGTKNTEFTTPCKAGQTCNQLTGYCISNCKTGSLNDQFCSCGTKKTFTDPVNVLATVPVNCLAGQFCVAYDELTDNLLGTFGSTAADVGTNQVGDAVPASALNVENWNGEPQCVDSCVANEKVVTGEVCACGSGFCTVVGDVCFNDQCIQICPDHFQTAGTPAVNQDLCKCGTEICVGNQVCSHGTCVDKCSDNIEIFEDQCWCTSATYVCNKGQLCDVSASINPADRCVDECEAGEGATRMVTACRCASNICSSSDAFNYCLNGTCVEGCTQNFYTVATSQVWCACGSTSCEKATEWCEDGKCIEMCTAAISSNYTNQGVAMQGTNRCWCNAGGSLTVEADYLATTVCLHSQPLCELGKCVKFLDQ